MRIYTRNRKMDNENNKKIINTCPKFLLIKF